MLHDGLRTPLELALLDGVDGQAVRLDPSDRDATRVAFRPSALRHRR